MDSNKDIKQQILSYLGIYKIKYGILNEISSEYDNDISNTDIFHIDLNMMFDTVFKIEGITDTYVDKYKFSIVSSILNLVAHFRAYFVTRHKRYVTFYMYYDSNTFDNTKKSKKINYKIRDKYIKNSMDILRIIVKYIPDVYLIDNSSSGIHIGAAMQYFNDKNKHNVVFTKNTIYYQLVSKHCKILRPNRDSSYCITRSDLYVIVSGGDVNEYDTSLNTDLYTAVISISGVGYIRGLKGIGFKRAVKMLDKAVKNGDMVNLYYSNMKELLYDIKLNDPNDRIKSNFNKLDFRKQYNKLSKSDTIILDSFIVDLFAKKDLQKLNIEYFTDFDSLMLNELLMNVKQSNDKKQINW